MGYRPWGCKRVGHNLTTKQHSGATPGIYLQPHCRVLPQLRVSESVNSESVLIRSKLKVKVAQTCPTLCDPMDYSLQGSFVHGILQARILEWVTVSFSRGSSRPRYRTQVCSLASRFFTPEPRGKPPVEVLYLYSSVQFLSLVRLCDLMDCSTPGFPVLHCLPAFAHTHIH